MVKKNRKKVFQARSNQGKKSCAWRWVVKRFTIGSSFNVKAFFVLFFSSKVFGQNERSILFKGFTDSNAVKRSARILGSSHNAMGGNRFWICFLDFHFPRDEYETSTLKQTKIIEMAMYWQWRLKKWFYSILCRFFFSRSFINGHFKDKKDTFTMQSETCQSPCNYLKS